LILFSEMSYWWISFQEPFEELLRVLFRLESLFSDPVTCSFVSDVPQNVTF
jgi:hypothetical protein